MNYSPETNGPILTPVDIVWLRRLKAFGPRPAQEIPIGTVSRLKIAGFILAEEAECIKSVRYGAKNWCHIQYQINPQGERYLVSLADGKGGGRE